MTSSEIATQLRPPGPHHRHRHRSVEPRVVEPRRARGRASAGWRRCRTTDRVGLVSLPPPGPRVEFTTEHARVGEAIGRVGAPPPTRPIPMGGINVSLWEALRISDGDMTVLTRGDRPRVPGRLPPIRSVPRTSTCRRATSRRTRRCGCSRSSASLRGLMQGLGQLPGPKHMVLLTSGWPIDERNAPTRALRGWPPTPRARTSRSTRSPRSSGRCRRRFGRPSPRMGMDSQMLVASVETLGGLYRRQELAAGGHGRARPQGADRRAHGLLPPRACGLPTRISNGTHPPHLREAVEGRRVAQRLSPDHGGDAAGVGDAAGRSGDGAAQCAAKPGRRDRPRAARHDRTCCTALAPPGELRVVIVGDIGRAAAGPAMSMAAIYDREGKPIVGGESSARDRAPARPPTSLQTAFPVKPGNYMLRVAVRDADGAIGMVERGVDARWLKAGAAETTGLILFRHQPGRGLPRAGPRHRDDRRPAGGAALAERARVREGGRRRRCPEGGRRRAIVEAAGSRRERPRRAR